MFCQFKFNFHIKAHVLCIKKKPSNDSTNANCAHNQEINFLKMSMAMKLPTHSPVFYKITKSHFSYSRFCSFLHTLNTNEMQRRNGNKHGALSFRKVTQEWATGSYRFGCWSNKIKKRTWTTYYSFVSIHSSSSIASACQISHDVDACNRQT